ncbi:MAG TPA: hypothetical protein VK939_14785 [Longimicrobiales bacterium]|nr:hypothetical protein [Longimicrobiales bacterium]
MRPALLALAVMSTAAAPLNAQEYAVSRRAWTFFERGLTIEVLADGPGALQIVRGEPGRIEVAAHARHGLAAWGLGGYRSDRLRLSALGATEADYVVIVPEDVHVSVTLPGEYGARSVSWEPAALLRWEGDADRPYTQDRAGSRSLEYGLFPVHRAPTSPARVDLPDARFLRSIEVRVEGREFLVGSSRPLSFTPGRGPLVIRSRQESLDLRITVPQGTTHFEVGGPEGVLVRVEQGRLVAACGPNVAVALPERQSVTLRPADGQLHCP